ncbi:MAG: ABC transporter ATP-binding protein [Bacteroidetes bacterium]|nr:ABC transporter ATP-binding protein [Bacteroidota bacterium]
MKKIGKIFKYAVPYWSLALLNIFFNVLFVAFSLVSLAMIVPFLQILFGNSKIVTSAPELTVNIESIQANFNLFISNIIVENGKSEALFFICLFVIGLYFMKNLSRYMGMFFMAKLRNSVVFDIRTELFAKVLILPLAYFSEQKKGDLISRMTSDVQEIENSIMSSLEMIFREPITIISFLAALIYISPQLSLFVLVFLPIAGLIIGKVGKNLRKNSNIVQNKLGGLISNLEETIGGIKILKAFNALDSSEKNFQNQNNSYTNLMVKVYRRKDLASPLSEVLGAAVFVVILWFGGNLVLKGGNNLTADTFIAYLAIFSQIINPAKSFTTAYYNIQKGMASADRIQQVLDAEEVIIERENAIPIKEFKNTVEFKNVSFSYQNESSIDSNENQPEIVLKNINLIIEKGKTIAIVGQSGSGKTTMANLLLRFYDCTEGEILIDGKPIRDCIISDVRGLIGIVTQESILFNDSVFNNIAFGNKSLNKQLVIDAAINANAHEFIKDMENQYDSMIGDRGTKLSGGQKQRLNIARAILKNPPILILDEATSSLDSESERLVQSAINELMKNRTSIIIAHRLSTIQFADEIIVLDQGQIAERGKHNELFEKNGIYRKLCDLQSIC